MIFWALNCAIANISAPLFCSNHFSYSLWRLSTLLFIPSSLFLVSVIFLCVFSLRSVSIVTQNVSKMYQNRFPSWMKEGKRIEEMRWFSKTQQCSLMTKSHECYHEMQIKKSDANIWKKRKENRQQYSLITNDFSNFKINLFLESKQ